MRVAETGRDQITDGAPQQGCLCVAAHAGQGLIEQHDIGLPVEHNHGIVFLHALEEGPASQSYGIEVAALAGIPGAVVRDAKRRLRALENREISGGPQADLFASLPPDEPETMSHPVLGALADIDPDALTPREALEALYELKRLGAG
jgi:DNA mismatch repair protein MutS